MLSKAEIREQMRAALAGILPAERDECSQRIVAAAMALPAWREACVVMCFVSMPSEVQTAELFRRGWADGKTMLAPHVDWAANVMAGVRLDSLERLKIGKFGVVELPAGPAADPASIDLLFAPAMAFDAEGYRLGRGGGYFDRFCSQNGFRAAIVGLGFDCQRVDRLPRDGHDVPVDVLVTESGAIRFR